MATATRRCSWKQCGLRQPQATMIINGKQAWCSSAHQYNHALDALGRLRKRKKVETKAKDRETLAKMKTRSDWLREAQQAFNAYIRHRDRHLPCVSCNVLSDIKQNAGHYRSVGSAPHLRFEPLNCWKQCERCNSYLSGNLIEYRKRLIERIGIQKVEWLESQNEVRKYTVDEIKAIKAEYKRLIKE